MNRGRAAPRGGRGTRSRGAAQGPDGARVSAPEDPSTTRSDSAGPSNAPTRRATRAPTAGRFKPKAVRRDEAERDALARAEEQKASERAAEERRARGCSRFRSKRNRGDAMGARCGWGGGTSTASGPFSGGFAGCTSSLPPFRPSQMSTGWAKLTSRAASGRPGGWFGGTGGGGIPGGGPRGGGSRPSKSEGKGFGEADAAHMRETRINADRLHVMTPAEELESDDEAMMAALSNRTASALPMGIYRREHKEKGVVVATTAELEAAEKGTCEEESLWVDGDGYALPAQQPQEEGVWHAKADKKIHIKKEPDLDEMDVDAAMEQSPGQGKKPLPEPTLRRAAAQDPEGTAIQDDSALLASELGAVTVTDEGESRTANKDGRMYLFQFPPLMPPLKVMSGPHPAATVKRERGSASGSVSGSVDVSRGGPAATEDAVVDDDGSADDDDEEGKETGGFRSQLLSRGGMIGKLRVRRSGRTELDWGGVRLETSPASGMNFLTTAVIVEENDEKAQHGVVGGESIGMGKIMGRFLLTPVWSDEEEWVVDAQDLAGG